MSILKNINYLKKMNVMGCQSPDIFVTIETGLAAAAPALLSLLVPGCTDIVKMKLGLSPWHRKGISSFIKGAAAPFALDANKFLYKIGYFTAEQGLYYLMVADIAVEFLTTWQSMAFAAYQCPLPSAGTAYGYIQPFIYGPGEDTLLGYAPQHNVPGMAIGLNQITIFPGYQGSVTFNAVFDSWPEPGKGVNVNTWMTEDDQTTRISDFTTNNPPSQPKNETMGHLSFDTLFNITRKDYYLHVQNNGENYAIIVGGSYSVNLAGHNQGVVPWGCKFKKTSIPFI
jgi:hypothetical protein